MTFLRGQATNKAEPVAVSEAAVAAETPEQKEATGESAKAEPQELSTAEPTEKTAEPREAELDKA